MPAGAVYCGRPTIWGNVFQNLHAYAGWIRSVREHNRKYGTAGGVPDLESLRGRHLACWCGLCDRHRQGRPLQEHCADCSPCHVDEIGVALYGG